MMSERYRFVGLTGLCCSALQLVLQIVSGKMPGAVMAACVTAVLGFAVLLAVRAETVSDILYVAVGTLCTAIPLLFSPTLTEIIWLAVAVSICPLVVSRRPVMYTAIMFLAGAGAAAVTCVSGADVTCGINDYIAAAIAVIAAAFVSYRARNLQESDKRRHARTIELLEDEKAELATGSMTDPLTGLFNKGYYEMILPKMIANHEQCGLPLTAIFVDIDHFKSINDTYGHDKGDRALVALAGVLQRYFRKEEIMRFGGEEFLMLLTVDAFTALKRTEAVRRAVEDMTTDGIRFTISCGLAEYRDDMDDGDLVKAADTQMYKAKNTGRNKVCM